MNFQQVDGMFGVLVLAQGEAPSAGAAPKVSPVGVPGATPATTTTEGGTASTTGGGTTGGQQSQGPGGLGMFLPLILVMVFIMVFSMFQGKKERKKREQLMNSIGKLDKVMISGGIIGKVIEINDVDVVLQLEDGKMRVVKSAIQQVMSSNAKPGSIAEAKPDGVAANV